MMLIGSYIPGLRITHENVVFHFNFLHCFNGWFWKRWFNHRLVKSMTHCNLISYWQETTSWCENLRVFSSINCELMKTERMICCINVIWDFYHFIKTWHGIIKLSETLIACPVVERQIFVNPVTIFSEVEKKSYKQEL